VETILSKHATTAWDTAPGIFIGGGAMAQEVWGFECPLVGPKGKGSRGPEAKAVCRHCLQILTAETIDS